MIRYEVSMPRPASHLFDIRMRIEAPPTPLVLVLPAWTPGSYKIRDYSRHLQEFRAASAEGGTLVHRKLDKNTWQVDHQGTARVDVSYRVYADELTVRTSHLDDRHGFFNGSNLFFFLPGELGREAVLKVVAPEGWQVTTALSPLEGEANLFAVPDYDTLADSPVECGTHTLLHFEVLGKPHQLALVGEGNFDTERLVADLQLICTTAATLFRDLPCERYVFITQLPSTGRGGLEHKNSTVLMAPRFGFRPRDRYEEFLALSAHEYFHLWNGKRMRPVGLGPFDYEREVHTRSLWVVEGWTSYYNDLLLRRAGLLDASAFLKRIGKLWNGLLDTPGRAFQSLTESSFDTWIKYYQRSAHSSNSTVSYYEKGSLVALLLDLEIRRRTQGQRSLDDVVRALWREYGRSETPYPEGAVEALAEEMAGSSLRSFFAAYIEGTDELPLVETLADFGIRTVADRSEDGDAPPWLGVRTRVDQGRLMVTEVVWDSPAARDGVNAGDELLAMDGHRLTDSALRQRVGEKRLDDTVELTLFRDDVLRRLTIRLNTPARLRTVFETNPEADAEARERYDGWMGQTHPSAVREGSGG